MILLLALAAAVQSPAQSAKCADPLTQADMNQCAYDDAQQADRALNAQWAKTSAAMKERDRLNLGKDGRPGYFDTLLSAQRSWLAYRDAHCRSAGYWARGGSMEPMLVSLCLAELTKTRIRQLADLIDQP